MTHRTRTAAVALMGLALLAPAASAQTTRLTPAEEQVLASRGVGAPTTITAEEQQVLASRGVGAPRPPVTSLPSSAPAGADDSFPWEPLVAGLAGVALLLTAAGTLAITRRRSRVAA